MIKLSKRDFKEVINTKFHTYSYIVYDTTGGQIAYLINTGQLAAFCYGSGGQKPVFISHSFIETVSLALEAGRDVYFLENRKELIEYLQDTEGSKKSISLTKMESSSKIEEEQKQGRTVRLKTTDSNSLLLLKRFK